MLLVLAVAPLEFMFHYQASWKGVDKKKWPVEIKIWIRASEHYAEQTGFVPRLLGSDANLLFFSFYQWHEVVSSLKQIFLQRFKQFSIVNDCALHHPAWMIEGYL